MQNPQKNLYKKLLGRWGELKAEKYLKRLGYNLKHSNLKLKSGEADIIAYEKDILVFIEVKTRTNDVYGKPCEAVDYKRQNRYINIAKEYIMVNNLNHTQVRFDIIEILNGEINHIKDAFCE